jgi:hypothetical protein
MRKIDSSEWNRIREIKRKAKQEMPVPKSDIQWLLDMAKRTGIPIPADLHAAAKQRKLNLDGVLIGPPNDQTHSRYSAQPSANDVSSYRKPKPVNTSTGSTATRKPRPRATTRATPNGASG